MNTKKNGTEKVFVFVSTVIVTALLFCTAASGQPVSAGNASAINSAADMIFKLIGIQADLQGSLNDLDGDVANASQDLSKTGLEGNAARRVLSKLMKTNSNLVEAVTVSKDGKIVVAECKDCEGGEGANISSQEHIAHILNNKTPAFSSEFLLVEGYNGTALAYPVFSPQGELMGGISTIIKPDDMIDASAAPELNGTDYSSWAMQLDGLIIYDKDAGQAGKGQVGLNLFEDPIYEPFPSLLEIAHKMVAERSGLGSYSFNITNGNKTVVAKDVYWTTVGLHGKEWRLAITKTIS